MSSQPPSSKLDRCRKTRLPVGAVRASSSRAAVRSRGHGFASEKVILRTVMRTRPETPSFVYLDGWALGRMHNPIVWGKPCPTRIMVENHAQGSIARRLAERILAAG